MLTLNLEAINLLEDTDKEKISYLVELLFKKEKYKNLSEEIKTRRDEIKQNKVLPHDEVWKSLDV